MQLSVLTHRVLIGYSILVVAIVLNVVAGYLHLSTRYDLLQKLFSQNDPASWNTISLGSRIFLLLIYPLTLGVTGYCTTRLLMQTFR